MRHRLALPFMAVAGLISACSDSSTLEPAASTDAAATPSALSNRLTVLTRNIYIGTDVDLVIGALATPDPSDDIPALLAGVATLQRTDFLARASALADEIARYRPHVVGLQEVDRLDIHLGPPLPVVDISQDFLAILQDELADRGLPYEVAAQVKNIDASPLPGIRLVDHDVILVDAERVNVGPRLLERNYSFNVGPVAPGVSLVRGFVMIDATIAGMPPVRIANTHLESGSQPGLSKLRAAQASELLAYVESFAPSVLLGDFNEAEGSPMHSIITGAGFADVWADLRPGTRGFTCCHAADLSNRTSALSQRIDYVFARGIGGPQDQLLGQVSIIGDQPSSKVAGPLYRLWPSDHAGVLAQFVQPPATAMTASR
jgi:endonuclease/exonuclease/phosphatase family metal-dependent hydrolase